MRTRFPFITAVIAGAAVLAGTAPGLAGCLEYSRTALLEGQWWRLISGHLAHFGGEHLFWDLVVFMVTGVYCEKRMKGSYSLFLLISSVSIGMFLFLLQPELEIYRGLSGIDTALFTAAMLMESTEPDWLKGLSRFLPHALLGLMILKMYYEMLFADTLFVRPSEFSPVPLAHAVGAFTAFAVRVGKSSVCLPEHPPTDS